MPLFNFQKQFASKVRSGKKTQTIRKKRKHPIKEGQKAHLYCGLRTKHCEKLGEFLISDVQHIEIHQDSVRIGDWVIKGPFHKNKFARRDGFKDWIEMRSWFERQYGLPVKNLVLTKWHFIKG